MAVLRPGQRRHWCSRCEKTKPVKDFYVSKGNIHTYCKRCFRDYNRELRATWTPAQWEEHHARTRDWNRRHPEKSRERGKKTTAKRRNRRPPTPPFGNVYKIPRGKLKGRLQINWRGEDGKRHRTLVPKGSSLAKAEEMLHVLQGEKYTQYLKDCLAFVKNGNRRSTDG